MTLVDATNETDTEADVEAEPEAEVAEPSVGWDAIEAITAAATAAMHGDFEARVAPLGEDPRLIACRDATNGMLDRADAYVRESSASLAEAAHHRYHRRFAVRGLDGSFRIGANTINAATQTMAATDATRAAEASGFMGSIATAVEQIVATAGAIDDQTRESSKAATAAISETDHALETFSDLYEASKRIGDVVAVIGDVADQTRLLSFNATIEAARAGESGKGFAVVANEVKELASQTAGATIGITNQIEQIQKASAAASAAVESMTESLKMLGANASVIADAVAEQRVALGDMARSSASAATAASEVTEGVGVITSSSQLTTDAASDLTDAALELSEMSGSLQVTVTDVVLSIREQ